VTEVEVENVGPSLEWATASVTKTSRQSDGGEVPAFAGSGGGGSSGSENGSAADEEPPF
jgi:single-strand DNA-binding protein